MAPPREHPAADVAPLDERTKAHDKRIDELHKDVRELRSDVKDLSKFVSAQNVELTKIATNLDAALTARKTDQVAEVKSEPWFTSAQRKMIAGALVAILTAVAALMGSFSSSSASEAKPVPAEHATESAP